MDNNRTTAPLHPASLHRVLPGHVVLRVVTERANSRAEQSYNQSSAGRRWEKWA